MASSKRPVAPKRIPRTKTELLPLAPALAQCASLRYHLAFEQWKNGRGTMALSGELLTMLYLTYLLVADELTDEGLTSLVTIEGALHRAAVHDFIGAEANPTQEECACAEAALREHDRVLRVTPCYVLLAARVRLQKFHANDHVLSLAAVLEAQRESQSN